eukprot:TRINITY_DN1127_c0_g1_i4.p2 TRINITY_DN1127_c0_g1~~TRINITY_DN1127_c0_g1_i4.p2  ORF type:complete len:118 (-),score=12.87 TRINITY_DN1127_c0_g1_i4:72-425(-)
MGTYVANTSILPESDIASPRGEYREDSEGAGRQKCKTALSGSKGRITTTKTMKKHTNLATIITIGEDVSRSRKTSRIRNAVGGLVPSKVEPTESLLPPPPQSVRKAEESTSKDDTFT